MEQKKDGEFQAKAVCIDPALVKKGLKSCCGQGWPHPSTLVNHVKGGIRT